MDTLPDFKAIVDVEMEKAQTLTRTPEYEALQAAMLSSLEFKKGLATTLYLSARKFAAIAEGGFPNEEDMLSSLSSRGVAGPIMDLITFGYIVGKNVGSAQSFEKMFGGSEQV